MPPHFSHKLSVACLAALLFVLGVFSPQASFARPEARSEAPLSEFKVAAYLEAVGGGFQDLFTKLNTHKEFSLFAAKHRLDDPAVWPVLERRFTFNLAESSRELTKAEAMIETQDRRSGLDGSIISAENTRAQGRALYDKLTVEIAEMQQALRLINEIKNVLERVESEKPLTEGMTLSSVEAQSLTGQVLLIDGEDLIVKHENGGYFRIPARMLSLSTKLNVLDAIFSKWDGLPHVRQEESIEKNAGELVAYDENLLYIVDRYEGLISENRADSKFDFMPYQERIDALKADDARNADKSARLKNYEGGLALNSMRIEAIDWYEARLDAEIVLSQRKKAKAHREELVRLEEAELETNGENAPEVERIAEDQGEKAEVSPGSENNTSSAANALSDHAGELEDRQEHGHNDTTDDDTEEGDE